MWGKASVTETSRFEWQDWAILATPRRATVEGVAKRVTRPLLLTNPLMLPTRAHTKELYDLCVVAEHVGDINGVNYAHYTVKVLIGIGIRAVTP